MGIAVVTGASAGIGRATALAFAADGWDVGLISRNEPRLARLRGEIERLGKKALALPLDVAAAADVEAAATRIEQTLGPIEASAFPTIRSRSPRCAASTSSSSSAAGGE